MIFVYRILSLVTLRMNFQPVVLKIEIVERHIAKMNKLQSTVWSS